MIVGGVDQEDCQGCQKDQERNLLRPLLLFKMIIKLSHSIMNTDLTELLKNRCSKL